MQHACCDLSQFRNCCVSGNLLFNAITYYNSAKARPKLSQIPLDNGNVHTWEDHIIVYQHWGYLVLLLQWYAPVWIFFLTKLVGKCVPLNSHLNPFQLKEKLENFNTHFCSCSVQQYNVFICFKSTQLSIQYKVQSSFINGNWRNSHQQLNCVVRSSSFDSTTNQWHLLFTCPALGTPGSLCLEMLSNNEYCTVCQLSAAGKGQ